MYLVVLRQGQAGTQRADQVLFIDARKSFNQIDRAHWDFTPEQIEFLSNIARLYRGEVAETDDGSADLMAESFPDGGHVEAAGLRDKISASIAGVLES